MTDQDQSPVADYGSLMRMDGLGVVVVGAGQGIGRQSAHACRALGAQVLCVDIEADRAEAVAKEVDGVACVADATEPAGAQAIVRHAVESLDRPWGAIDVVGMARWVPLLDTSDDDYEWALRVNARHAFFLTRDLGRVLVERGGGSLVFVGSISGTSSAPKHVAYGMAKAGLLSLVRTAAVELGPHQVRVNAVSPGTTATPRFVSRSATAPPRPNAEPLGHVARTMDIASAALFLVSPISAHTTGQNLIVDGGATSNFPVPTP
jgi:NAD(P)-dependent dehydrogenase (short-subunit alcohol dehydrogenase family)